jgi:hypothetical protein
VRRIRGRFPHTSLIIRADSHHTKPEVLDWLEKNGVHYALGLATHAVLRREVDPLLARAASIQREEWTRFRCFHLPVACPAATAFGRTAALASAVRVT